MGHSDLVLIHSFFLTFTTNFNSFILQDDKDELRRSPGTPVFTAPECILGGCFLFKLVRYYCCGVDVQVLTAVLCLDMFLGVKYGGKAADTWAVGVTLYCMILGEYPFLGDTLQDTYDKVRNTHVFYYNYNKNVILFSKVLTLQSFLTFSPRYYTWHSCLYWCLYHNLSLLFSS